MPCDSSPMPAKAVIWDLDGTLLDTGAVPLLRCSLRSSSVMTLTSNKNHFAQTTAQDLHRQGFPGKQAIGCIATSATTTSAICDAQECILLQRKDKQMQLT